MKYITLSNGKRTSVDDEDFIWLSKWNWHESPQGYAIRRVGNPGKVVWMHREINKTPEHLQTDHINRNRRDNRRANLRSATRSSNILNSKKRVDNTSGIKGVSWDKEKKRWLAYIGHNGKLIKLGRHFRKTDAIKARQKAELLYH